METINKLDSLRKIFGFAKKPHTIYIYITDDDTPTDSKTNSVDLVANLSRYLHKTRLNDAHSNNNSRRFKRIDTRIRSITKKTRGYDNYNVIVHFERLTMAFLCNSYV